MMRFAAAIAVGLGVLSAWADSSSADEWLPGDYHPWSRQNTHRFSIRADGVAELRHRGKADWSLDAFERIPTKPGEAFTFTCRSERASDAELSRPFRLCAALFDAQGRLMAHDWGAKACRPGESGTTTFLIPNGAAFVQPRFIGTGDFAGAFPLAKFMRAENVERVTPEATLKPVLAVSSPFLDVTFTTTNGVFAVKDRRTGRVWSSTPRTESASRTIVIQSAFRRTMFAVRFVDGESLMRYTVVCRLEPDAPEFEVSVNADSESPLGADVPLAFPPPLSSRPGDRVIIPQGEGYGVPSDSKIELPQLAAFSGQDLSMAFFGVVEDRTGAGWMAILETPDDAYALPVRLGADRLWSVGPAWIGQRGRFGYARKVRYAFVDKGGPVALAKRYRAYALAKGLVRTLREKAQTRPRVAQLPGIANVCYLPARGDKGAVEMAAALQAAGIDRLLWNQKVAPSAVRELAAQENVLVSCHDLYRDVYHPEQLRKLGWTHGPNEKAWPRDVNWQNISGAWRRADKVASRTGENTYCAMMCDCEAPKHARARLASEQRMRPYGARTVDAFLTEPWQECWHPNHPMTRTVSRLARLEVLGVMADEFKLVVGAEQGHDACLRNCDYFEGLLSPMAWRMPPGGGKDDFRQPETPANVAPEQLAVVALRALAPELRLPLWELVYHDCGVAFWHWRDASNWPLSLWRRRDLFNVLYGTSGTFTFDGGMWEKERKRFVASYRLWSPVARQTGFSEMVDHQCLTPDRLVQRSVFADGTSVVVNFGDKSYTTADGREVAPMSAVVAH